jgi:hypothetical protein
VLGRAQPPSFMCARQQPAIGNGIKAHGLKSNFPVTRTMNIRQIAT